ncbi:MAG: nitroreductase/quinone reductase family protein [Candidatus Binatia bacterium]
MAPNGTPAWKRAVAGFAAQRWGTWLFLHVIPPIDRALMGASRGRLKVAMGYNMCLLETVGARSGAIRATPLLYIEDGERLVLIASKGGALVHPDWWRNLRATPRAVVTFKGRRAAYAAHEAEGAERERLWARAVEYYPGYATYQRRAAARRIPVVVLTPEAGAASRAGG